MVTDRAFKGQNLTRHPLVAEGEPLMLFARMPPIMCVRALQGGRLETNKGEVAFHAGDWICTDFPPSYAWIVDQQTFAVASYTKLGTVEDGEQIVFPIAEAGHEVESSMYTGRLETDTEKQIAAVELMEVSVVEDTQANRDAGSGRVTAVRPSHPSTKATLPQQNPEKAMAKPERAVKRP